MQQGHVLCRADGLNTHVHQFGFAVTEKVLKLLVRCEEAQTGNVNDVRGDGYGGHRLLEITLLHQRHAPRLLLNAAELEGTFSAIRCALPSHSSWLLH